MAAASTSIDIRLREHPAKSDGVNDAPALKVADIGIAIRSVLQDIGAFAAAAAVLVISWRMAVIDSDARMLTFSTLLLTNLALIFTNRS